MSKKKHTEKERKRYLHEKPIVDTKKLNSIEKPFFSVCIPTYNRVQMLPTAIESVLAQDFNDFELIICDNASTDNTEEVVKGYDDQRIRYLRYSRLVSMYANHNRFLDYVQSDWVIFLHSDDRLQFNAMSVYRCLIQEVDNAAVFYPAAQLHKSVDAWVEYSVNCYLLSHPYQLYRYPAGTPSGAVYQLRDLKKYRFNEDTLCADLDLLLKISKEGKLILIVDEKLVNIGNQQTRVSKKWHLSGKFIGDVSSCLCLHLNASIFSEILKTISSWNRDEISLLMLFLTYQGKLDQVNKIETALGTANCHKSSPHYRHVVASRLLGYQLYKYVYRVIKFLKLARYTLLKVH